MNTVTRRLDNPLTLDVFSDFDKLINGFFTPHRSLTKSNGSAMNLAIDVVEKDNAYEIKADLPGVNKEDLSVTLEDGVLTISAQTKSEQVEESQGKVIRRERRFGQYSRSLTVGKDVDENSIDARYTDGVLKLTLAKAEQAKAKKIAING